MSRGRTFRLRSSAGRKSAGSAGPTEELHMTLPATGKKQRPEIWKSKVLRGLIYTSIFFETRPLAS